MKLLNKVKDELKQSKGYDFGSEFWTGAMLSVAYDLVYATEKVLNEKVEVPKKESTTKFIKLPTYVQEMIEAETHEIINRAERETPLLVNRASFWINALIHELKEAKATAYFREMELIDQITELRKEVEDGKAKS